MALSTVTDAVNSDSGCAGDIEGCISDCCVLSVCHEDDCLSPFSPSLLFSVPSIGWIIGKDGDSLSLSFFIGSGSKPSIDNGIGANEAVKPSSRDIEFSRLRFAGFPMEEQRED